MSIQGSQLAPAGAHQEHHWAPPGKHHEHHRGHVSPLEGRFGTHPLEPKKKPAPGAPKSLHSTGIGCKNGPGVATCWGDPPHTPLSLLAEQVLTIETKGSLGRAFVIASASCLLFPTWNNSLPASFWPRAARSEATSANLGEGWRWQPQHAATAGALESNNCITIIRDSWL